MRRIGGLAAAATVAALTLAACGGDSGGVSVGGDATTVAPGDTSKDGAATTGSSDDGSTATSGGDGTAPNLDELLQESSTKSFYVKYEVTPENGTSSVIVKAQDPPKVLLQTDDSALVLVDDKGYQCSVEGDTRTCQELPKEAAEQLVKSGLGLGILDIGTTIVDQARKADSSFVTTSDAKIAGRDATCITVDTSKFPQAGATGDLEFCVDDDTGVTLRMKLGGTSIEATEVRDPKDADFATS